MDSSAKLSRRSALTVMGGATVGVAAASVSAQESSESSNPAPLKGRLKQSVCQWCYEGMSLDDLCRHSAAIGLKSVELLGENDWATTKKYGLTCAMANGPSGISPGWNRPQDHDALVKESERLLPLVAEAGLPNMILFSGNRAGMSDAEGLKNCAKGIKRITALAEEVGVTLCMELLNSKRDHKDYQCDHTPWGVDLVNEVGHDSFKLLYDIYHMQIMEGDVIDTILENYEHIAHFHTGGVPGRNEIDDTQELNYRRICEVIVEQGYDGYLAQEFIPVHDPMKSLAHAARICDV